MKHLVNLSSLPTASDWFSLTGEIISHVILNCIFGNLCCMDQDVCICSLCKQQPQGFFDAKMQAVADDYTDAAATATERYLVT